jgi:hypothetical protein
MCFCWIVVINNKGRVKLKSNKDLKSVQESKNLVSKNSGANILRLGYVIPFSYITKISILRYLEHNL